MSLPSPLPDASPPGAAEGTREQIPAAAAPPFRQQGHPTARPRQRIGASVEGHPRGPRHRDEYTSAHCRSDRQVSDVARTRRAPVRSACSEPWDERLHDSAGAAAAVHADMPTSATRLVLVGAPDCSGHRDDPARGSFEALAPTKTQPVLDGSAAREAVH